MMINPEYDCTTCLFRDNCPSCSSWGCQNHAHEQSMEEDDLWDYIEERRREYYDEWRVYMSDDWD